MVPSDGVLTEYTRLMREDLEVDNTRNPSVLRVRQSCFVILLIGNNNLLLCSMVVMQKYRTFWWGKGQGPLYCFNVATI